MSHSYSILRLNKVPPMELDWHTMPEQWTFRDTERKPLSEWWWLWICPRLKFLSTSVHFLAPNGTTTCVTFSGACPFKMQKPVHAKTNLNTRPLPLGGVGGAITPGSKLREAEAEGYLATWRPESCLWQDNRPTHCCHHCPPAPCIATLSTGKLSNSPHLLTYQSSKGAWVGHLSHLPRPTSLSTLGKHQAAHSPTWPGTTRGRPWASEWAGKQLARLCSFRLLGQLLSRPRQLVGERGVPPSSGKSHTLLQSLLPLCVCFRFHQSSIFNSMLLSLHT